MGRRKDRIHAAMSNAGRRVKLDLSAEPYGDLGGSLVHDEVTKETEWKERAGLPNSPSSSGQQQQNPLQLLGQYSDDEIDDEPSEKLKGGFADNSSVENKNQVKGPSVERSEDKDVNTGEQVAVQEVMQQDRDGYVVSPNDFQRPEVVAPRESYATATIHLHSEINLSEQTSAAGTSGIQIVGEVSSGWKMVLHEESNQYYYWNIETGQTSWEVPQVLVRTAESTTDQRTATSENAQSIAAVTHESNSTIGAALDYYSTAVTVDGSMGANMLSQYKDAYELRAQINETVEGSRGEVLKDENGAAGVSQIELSCTRGAADAFSDDGKLIGSGMDIQGSMNIEENRTEFDLSASIVRQSEELLQKLQSLKGSKGHPHGHDWASKYVLEIEIRLSDIKSLLSYGSLLLPFWLHSERQLKRLEGAVDEEIYQIAKSQVDEVMETHISSYGGEDKSLEMEHESLEDGDQNNTKLSAAVISKVSPNTDMSTAVDKDLSKEDSFRIGVHAENVASTGSPTRHLESGATFRQQVNGTVLPDESFSEPGYHAEEDVDMDVDVEVEDSIPAGHTSIRDMSSAKDFAPLEQPAHPIPTADYSHLPSEDTHIIPPPPDDEWIPPPPPDNEQVPPPPPPPPPDNEQVPPPPPDEPPEPSYSPTTSYMENVQPHPYTDQCNLSYPDSSFTYYGHTVTGIPSSSLYGRADESQVDAPHASIYYGVVSNMYNETASVMVNPVPSVAYYTLQDGIIPPDRVASSIESSENQSLSALASDQIGSTGTPSEAGAAVKVNVSALGGGTDVGPVVGVPSTSATVTAPATFSEKESFPSLSTNAVTSAVATATTSSTAKVQSKVRKKKRTVTVATTLRSNKKVSSLVDKWKAAKEELNEDEEKEPENPLDILEKKRQREIEEWRAQQIASGEAKDNANFQPLAGDWREKVKRRRAQLAKEAVEPSSEAQTDGNQQPRLPDLVDLSKDLPSGWQAYWDETSKQVYYGNTITSETTWTRPTK